MAEGFEIIMVDYVQLIKNGLENEVQDISMSSSLLRGFSLKYNVPTLAAAQLNREIVHRAVGAEPELPDLRGSGCLEQDSVIVVFNSLIDVSEDVLRNFPENFDPDGTIVARRVPMRLYVKKQRNGPLGKTNPILWDKSTNRFFPLQAEDGRPWQPPQPTTRRTRAHRQPA